MRLLPGSATGLEIRRGPPTIAGGPLARSLAHQRQALHVRSPASLKSDDVDPIGEGGPIERHLVSSRRSRASRQDGDRAAEHVEHLESLDAGL